jgi:translocation and assembly module TamB
MNLTVKVPDDLVLNGKNIQPGNTPIGLGNVNITLGGNLRVSKRPSQTVRLVGQVNTVRGTYEFQGRQFDIQRDGRVRFDGFVPVDPSLDITATRLIEGVEAKVHVGGTMRKPELTLTSNPPLDEADILSLIIFNQSVNSLGEGQQVSLAQRASALATGFVASKLADSLGRALNLDVFEIQTEATPGGGQGATVTLGEQVGRNLYFKVIQGVGADNLSQFVLDYTLTNWLRFETTMSQGGTATRTLMRRVEQSGADLIFFFSY